MAIMQGTPADGGTSCYGSTRLLGIFIRFMKCNELLVSSSHTAIVLILHGLRTLCSSLVVLLFRWADLVMVLTTVAMILV